MDYGKLAYLKALDLEGRLGIKDNKFSVWQSGQKSIPSGEAVIAEIHGNGDIAVFIRASGKGVFYSDGAKVGEGDSLFFKLTGGGKISVKSDGIAELDILAIGNILSSEGASYMFADYNGDFLAFVTLEDGKFTAYFAHSEYFSPSNLFEGSCVHCDVCSFEDTFLFAFAGGDGKVEMIALDGRTRTLELGAQRIALTADDNGILGAYTKKGELYFFVLKRFEDEATPVKLLFNGAVDDVRFVKKSNKLLFSSGGKCYIKELAPSAQTEDRLSVSFSAEVL